MRDRFGIELVNKVQRESDLPRLFVEFALDHFAKNVCLLLIFLQSQNLPNLFISSIGLTKVILLKGKKEKK